MTATDTIRAMLDERGVEWDYGITGSTTTKFRVNGIDLTFTPMRDGLVCSTILTPDQAIDATLGRGECRNAAPSYLDFLCSECGFVHYHSDTNDTGDGNEWNYCPNCGKRVRA